MSKYNIGIFLFYTQITAVSSSINRKKESISGHACAPTPACDFAATVANPTEQITRRGKLTIMGWASVIFAHLTHIIMI